MGETFHNVYVYQIIIYTLNILKFYNVNCTSVKLKFKKRFTVQWRRQAPQRVSIVGGTKFSDITHHGNPEGRIPD